jgi:hypothetical protein
VAREEVVDADRDDSIIFGVDGSRSRAYGVCVYNQKKSCDQDQGSKMGHVEAGAWTWAERTEQVKGEA